MKKLLLFLFLLTTYYLLLTPPILAQGTCSCYWTTLLPSGYDCTDTGAAQQCNASGGGVPKGCNLICPPGGCTGTLDEYNHCLGLAGYSNPCYCELTGVTCQQACDASYPGYTGICETGSINPHAPAGDAWCGAPLSCYCIPPATDPNCFCTWVSNTQTCTVVDNCGPGLDPFGCVNEGFATCDLASCACTNYLSPTPALPTPPPACIPPNLAGLCTDSYYDLKCPNELACVHAYSHCALCMTPTPAPHAVFDPCRHLSGSTKSSCDNCTDAGNAWTSIGCLPTSIPRGFAAWLLGRSIAVAGGIAFLLMLYASFLILTSRADPQKLQAGKELMTAAIIGLLMLVFSLFIIRFAIGATLGLPLVG